MRASELILKFLKGNLTEHEQAELDKWIAESDANYELFIELTDPMRIGRQLRDFYPIDTAAAYERLERRLFPVKTIRMSMFSGARRYVAVAAAIFFVTAIVWVCYVRSYKTAAGDHAAADLVHEGKKANAVLPDGTGVWLDKVSTVRYPNTFDGKARSVSLKGGCYFEVAEGEAPFYVKLEGLDMQVTGKKFNLVSQDGNAVVTSEIFKRGVHITKNSVSFDLAPDQQLKIDPQESQVKMMIAQADIPEALRGKSGSSGPQQIDIPDGGVRIRIEGKKLILLP